MTLSHLGHQFNARTHDCMLIFSARTLLDQGYLAVWCPGIFLEYFPGLPQGHSGDCMVLGIMPGFRASQLTLNYGVSSDPSSLTQSHLRKGLLHPFLENPWEESRVILSRVKGLEPSTFVVLCTGTE